MTLPPLVKQAIARDQNEVASKLSELIALNGIDWVTLRSVKTERFGSNQFLLVVVYCGTYLYSASTGLACTVVAAKNP